jgi:hypothetical protein
MYHAVTSVKPVEGYRLIIGFDNGEFRNFDVAPLLSLGRFGELASQQEFMKAKVAFDTVEWENGLDLDPEYLYEHSEAMPCEPSVSAGDERPHA